MERANESNISPNLLWSIKMTIIYYLFIYYIVPDGTTEQMTITQGYMRVGCWPSMSYGQEHAQER